MKFLFQILLLHSIPFILNAQVVESEKVDWNNLSIYSTQDFKFNSDKLNFACKDCKYAEIRTLSGVSGYFVLGNSKITVREKSIDENSSGAMIRLNPMDSTNFLKITGAKRIEDKGFSSLTLLVLNDVFKRCYHSAMDALIPNAGDYTIDIFSEKEGDFLIAVGDGKMQYFNVTNKGAK